MGSWLEGALFKAVQSEDSSKGSGMEWDEQKARPANDGLGSGQDPPPHRNRQEQERPKARVVDPCAAGSSGSAGPGAARWARRPRELNPAHSAISPRPRPGKADPGPENGGTWEGKLFKQIILVSNQLVFAQSSTIDLTE